MTMEGKLRVGDHALVEFPATFVAVRVIEDRGGLGVGGRQIVRVAPVADGDDLDGAFEMPAELLVPDTEAERERLTLLAAARRRAGSRGRPAA